MPFLVLLPLVERTDLTSTGAMDLLDQLGPTALETLGSLGLLLLGGRIILRRVFEACYSPCAHSIWSPPNQPRMGINMPPHKTEWDYRTVFVAVICARNPSRVILGKCGISAFVLGVVIGHWHVLMVRARAHRHAMALGRRWWQRRGATRRSSRCAC